MIILYAVLVLLVLYIIFAVGPAAVIYHKIFSRKSLSEELGRRELIGTRYEPYMDELLDAERYVKSLSRRQISITARDGVVLRGEYADNNSCKTVIFCHGYRGYPIGNFCAQARDLYRAGFNLLFITQRGHGDSGGKRVGLGIIEQYDILSWIDYEGKKENIEEILLFGSSMGSSAIAYSSDKIKSEKVKGMVIDCGFSCTGKQLVYESANRKIPPFLVMPIIRLIAKIELGEDIYVSACESLKKTKIPALFFHGTTDKTVPIESGIENYNACASDKKFVSVDGAEHLTAYVAGGTEAKNELKEFINKNFK